MTARLQRRATLRSERIHRTDPRPPAAAPPVLAEGHMDLVVLAVVAALAALGYLWLALVERA